MNPNTPSILMKSGETTDKPKSVRFDMSENKVREFYKN